MEIQNNVQKSWRTRQEKEELIFEWQQSGKSRKEFCQEKGITYNSLVSWCKQFKDKKIVPGFTEVKIPAAATSDLFAQVHLNKGIRIDFFHFVPADYFQSLLK